MKILILPGNSKHNKAWAYELKEHLGMSEQDVYVHEYQHWKTGDEFIDIYTELNKLKETIDNKQEYKIVAKSVGTLLTIKGAEDKVLNPELVVLLGVPYSLLNEEYSWFWNLLKKVETKTSVIQNDNDPLGSYSVLSSKLDKEDINLKTLRSLPGDTHDYLDFKEICNWLV